MRCLPDLTLGSDIPVWLTREQFLQHFDQADFEFRENTIVAHSYLAAWFHTAADGIPRFLLPTVQFVAGKTQFINGRHRTAVLFAYLEEVPVAFAATNKASQAFLGRLALRPLSLHEFVDLPDLPISESLP